MTLNLMFSLSLVQNVYCSSLTVCFRDDVRRFHIFKFCFTLTVFEVTGF